MYKSPLTTLSRALFFPLLVTLVLCLLKTINLHQDTRVLDGVATTPTRVLALADAIYHSDSRRLVFVRNGIAPYSLQPIIDGVASLPGIQQQRVQIQTIDDPNDLYIRCQQSLDGRSDYFAAVVFEAYSETAVRYTIALDTSIITNDDDTAGSSLVDDRSATASHMLPLQWALDACIGNFTTAPRPFLNLYNSVWGARRDPLAAAR